MTSFRWSVAVLAPFLSFVAFTPATIAATAVAPHLQKHGSATQLVVEGKPFLILGGELLNSSSSSREYMRPIWDRLAAQHLNTVLAPVSWELTEPEEGRFDFQLIDGLIADARAHQMHLVVLWLASWKNGMSSYAPVWVKRDTKRFPRVELAQGEIQEVLTPLSLITADADARAFAALMKHIREIDSRDQTVVMMQVENEVGILNDSRDRSPAANAAFKGPVPSELLNYLKEHRADLVPELLEKWGTAGAKNTGSWTDVFGPGLATDELFMAWHYARYVDRVAAAGTAAYPIPFYVNAWLNEKDAKPGDYPSGGPLAHLLNIWQAGAPHLSLIGPDLYASNFEERCQRFTRSGNPLFIPETNRGEVVGRNLFQAVGAFNCIGFSPFGIDMSIPPAMLATLPPSARMGDELQTKAYETMAQIAPLVLEHQGGNTITGFALDKEHPSFVTTIGDTTVEISLDEIFGHKAEKGYGIVMATGSDEFLGAGVGFRVIFKSVPATNRLGIGSVDEGIFHDGSWINGRRLNGDEDDQGRAWRFSSWGGPQIERCRIYRY